MRVHLISLFAIGAAALPPPPGLAPPAVLPNDNRAAAGRLTPIRTQRVVVR